MKLLTRVIDCDVLRGDSEMPMPFTSAGQPDKPVFSSSKETSSIVVEKKDEITASLGTSNSSRMIDSGSRSMHDVADTTAAAAGIQSADVTAAGNVGADAVKTTAVAASTAQPVYSDV